MKWRVLCGGLRREGEAACGVTRWHHIFIVTGNVSSRHRKSFTWLCVGSDCSINFFCLHQPEVPVWLLTSKIILNRKRFWQEQNCLFVQVEVTHTEECCTKNWKDSKWLEGVWHRMWRETLLFLLPVSSTEVCKSDNIPLPVSVRVLT